MIKYRYLLAIVLMLSGKSLFAQEATHAWASGADDRDLSFGFTFQYVSTDFKIIKKPDWRSPFYDPLDGHLVTDSLVGISAKSSSGFGIGFITRYRLSEHLEARLTPTLVFADRLIDYEYANVNGNPLLANRAVPISPNLLEQQVQTTMVEFPLLLKIKSDRIGNFRAYMIGGVKYSMLISSKKDDEKLAYVDKYLKNAGSFASYEAGIGFDLYFEYFKLSPEIKISNSFKNVLVPENHPYSRPIDKLFLHQIMFSLYFE